MDPVAALAALDHAEMIRDREGVAEAANALIGWLERGGFMPVGPHGADWRGALTCPQLVSHLRALRHVAEMA